MGGRSLRHTGILMNRYMKCAALALLLGAMAPWAGAVPVAQKELDLVLKRTPDATRGARLYETCSACHGPNAQGVSDGTVPTIAGESYTVLAKQLVDFRAGVRPDPRMQHFSDTQHLAYSQDIADVSLYVSRLPPRSSHGDAAAEVRERGAALYARTCQRCHGAAAQGKEDELAPRLAGQHADYIVRQLRYAVDGTRPLMTPTHSKALKEISQGDVAAVAAFLSSMGSAPSHD